MDSCICSGLCYSEGALEIHHFHSTWKQACSLSGFGKISLIPEVLAIHTTLRNGPGREQSEPDIPKENAQRCSGSMADCFSQHPCLCICTVYTHRFLFFSMGYSPLLSLFGHWELLQNGSCLLLICPHQSLSRFLLFVTKCYRLYQFPRIAIAKYHKLVLCSIKHRNLFSHSSGGSRSKIKCQQSLVLIEGCRVESSLAATSFWWPRVFFDLCQRNSSFCLCLHGLLPGMSVSKSSFPFSHIDTSYWIWDPPQTPFYLFPTLIFLGQLIQNNM